MFPIRNWKTTLAGLVAVLMAVCKALGIDVPVVDDATISLMEAGVGLLVAKDHNVTGR